MNAENERASKIRRIALRLKNEGTAGGVIASPRSRRASYASIVGLAVVAAVAAGQLFAAQAAKLPDGAAYRIGERFVSEEQLSHRMDVLRGLYGIQPPPDGPKQDEYRRASAKAVAVSDVLDEAKGHEGIRIADKEATDQLNKLIEQSFPAGRSQFLESLGGQGIGERDVLDEIKRQLSNAQMYDKITGTVSPASEQEVRKSYDDRRAQMVTPEQRHLRNIVVGSEQEAKDVRARIERGEDFGSVARQVSQDKSSRPQGGDLGMVSEQQLDPGYGKSAFANPQNSLFGPVHTQYGWNVGQVMEATGSEPLSFEQIKKQLTDELNGKKKLDTWNAWLQQRVKDADITYAERFRPADPDAPPIGGAPR